MGAKRSSGRPGTDERFAFLQASLPAGKLAGMSYDQDCPATVSVIVLDWWTEQPLQGVPVRIAGSIDRIRADCQGCYRSTLTDERGRAEFPAETGSVFVFIPPDFEQQVFTVAGEVTEVRFLCPDFVKKVRHGF